jgi:hypothetical protein
MRFDKENDIFEKVKVDQVVSNARNPLNKDWHNYKMGLIDNSGLNRMCFRFMIHHLRHYEPKSINYYANQRQLEYNLGNQESNLYWLERAKDYAENDTERRDLNLTIEAIKKAIDALTLKVRENYQSEQPKKKARF